MPLLRNIWLAIFLLGDIMAQSILGFNNLDEFFAFHAAPAIAGIKPANLFSCPTGLMPQAEEILADYEKQFKDSHTRFKLLCRCRAHILILVYDTELTEKIFQKKVIQNYLARFGYEANTGVQDFLNQIAAKIAGGESFPHEIGIILGYPPEDIEGFKRYKGRNFKCCGYWKVYGNAERAQKMFDAYTLCREKLMQALQNGVTLKVLLPLPYKGGIINGNCCNLLVRNRQYKNDGRGRCRRHCRSGRTGRC